MPRTYLTIVFFLSLITVSNAQNLVPNPSFEELRGLPIKPPRFSNFEFEGKSSNKAFKNHLNYWFSANNTTPDLRVLDDDYYKDCIVKYDNCDLARTGENVIGIITYMQNEETDSYREYMEVKLKESLKVGVKTYVELWVKHGKKSEIASNNIGFYFSKRKIFADILEPIKVKPQVNHDALIKREGEEWIKIKGEFTPSEPYQFLTIGNFYSNEKTEILKIRDVKYPHETPNAYYIIDDINVWQEGGKKEVTVFKNEEIKVGAPITLENVEFDTNSSTLRQNSYTELKALVALMSESNNIKIGIYGHTDNVGSQEANLKLSNDRAATIYQYLLENGIEKERMIYKGFGENSPIFDNSTEEGREKNRRVEFVILSK